MARSLRNIRSLIDFYAKKTDLALVRGSKFINVNVDIMI